MPHLKHIHIEAIGGVAGDMLLAALCNLGADLDALVRAFQSVSLPFLKPEIVDIGGIQALYVQSIPSAQDPAFRSLKEIEAIIDKAEASKPAKHWAKKIIQILGKAEANVHQCSLSNLHLHEVGQLDSIMDILGFAIAWDSVGQPSLSCLPLPSGHGSIRTSHGELLVPVPAVQYIADEYDIPLSPIARKGETITPTGISVLAAMATQFINQNPVVQADHSGIGAGTFRFPDAPNILRMYGFEIQIMKRGKCDQSAFSQSR